MTTVISKDFWCPRVKTCFDTFVENPSSLQHLLLFGPPGSGKTTSAQWLVSQIWKNQKALMCISMNAADERSLESIRQKIFPFLRATWTTLQTNPSLKAPRFIILDECETLTEAAQLSLQTILDKDPKEVCVILICNSQSRIHPKLRQRLLRIRYDPPHRTGFIGKASESTPPSSKGASDAFHEITRGDLRFENRKAEIEERLWFYINSHPEEIKQFLSSTNTDTSTILTEILLLMNLLFILDKPIIELINHILPLIGAGVQQERTFSLVERVIKMFKLKFEEHLKQ